VLSVLRYLLYLYLEQIKAKLKFFPSPHRIFLTRPSVIPSAVTTGIGPQGWKVTYFQPSNGIGYIIDPSLLSKGPPPHLLVFGNNATNMQQPQSPLFVWLLSPPDLSIPSSCAQSPIPVGDGNASPPSQPPSSQSVDLNPHYSSMLQSTRQEAL